MLVLNALNHILDMKHKGAGPSLGLRGPGVSLLQLAPPQEPQNILENIKTICSFLKMGNSKHKNSSNLNYYQ